VAVAINRRAGAPLPALAQALQHCADIERFQISHARN